MEMYPKVQYYFKYLHSQPHPQRKAVCPGRGCRPWDFTGLWELMERDSCSLAFRFSVARSQKHLLSNLDPKVRREHRANPP